MMNNAHRIRIGVLERRLRCGGMVRLDWIVLIAVVTGLAALLMTVLSKQRSTVRTVYCLNNLQALGLALGAYTGDNDMWFPLNYDGLPAKGQPPGWVSDTMTDPVARGDRIALQDPMRTALAPYLLGPGAFKCPADQTDAVRSVAMNCRINPIKGEGDPRWLGGAGIDYLVFRRYDQMLAPARTFTIIDEDEASINDGYFAVDLSNTGHPYALGPVIPLVLVDFPARRHHGRAGVLFGDGRVEQVQWMDALVSSRVRYPGMRVDLESQDVRWLHETSIGMEIYE